MKTELEHPLHQPPSYSVSAFTSISHQITPQAIDDQNDFELLISQSCSFFILEKYLINLNFVYPVFCTGKEHFIFFHTNECYL